MTIRVLAGEGQKGGLPVERIMEIRRRINGGYFERPETMEKVARRLLESGDLEYAHPSPRGTLRRGTDSQKKRKDLRCPKNL